MDISGHYPQHPIIAVPSPHTCRHTCTCFYSNNSLENLCSVFVPFAFPRDKHTKESCEEHFHNKIPYHLPRRACSSLRQRGSQRGTEVKY
ncbi:hypothetical protein E2C01_028796 [Portunus trituberculatus]|uniref:Uncharacterized protein n=1 Tax=Portunus trituberculatus TaxID=210409 RepID=A0A5B7ESS5_PORTR|nr:hypothetical protein [Portunus trituberculatus]